MYVSNRNQNQTDVEPQLEHDIETIIETFI